MNKSHDIYGSFYLGDCEFALNVEYVMEVVNRPPQLTKVPLAPSYFKGLMNLRGVILPVIDLCEILNIQKSVESEQKVAIIEYQGTNIGVIFDRTGEVFRDQADEHCDFESQNEELQVISGVFKKEDGKRIVQILDVLSIFRLKNLPLQDADEKHSLRTLNRNKRGPRMQAITFRVGESLSALEIQSIQEIIKIEKVESSALAIHQCIGMINLRGNTVPVIDFPALMGERDVDRSESATHGDRRIVIIRIEKEFFGLLVDKVENIISYFKDEIVDFPKINHSRAKMFKSCLLKDEVGEILILDHQMIFTNEEVTSITKGHSKLYQVKDKQEESQLKSDKFTYITFRVQDLFALSISQVQEIIEYPEELVVPPGLPSHFDGLLNIRGDLVTIVDTRKLYKMSEREADASKPKILILKNEQLHFGLVVDDIEAITIFHEYQRTKLPSVLYKQSVNRMVDDVEEAVEVKFDEEKKSLLILNPRSMAERILKAKEAA